jgi:hypothetical protein
MACPTQVVAVLISTPPRPNPYCVVLLLTRARRAHKTSKPNMALTRQDEFLMDAPTCTKKTALPS